MNDMPIVSNASPLIALAQIDHLDLLKQLFQTIVISPAVVKEISPTVSIPDWIEQHELSQPIDPFILSEEPYIIPHQFFLSPQGSSPPVV